MKDQRLRVAVAVVILAVTASGAAGQTASPIVVAAGGNLQAALNQAQPGQVVEVQAGATFDGNFILPVKTGTGYITVRTSTPDAQLPAAGTRIGLAHESLLPTLRSVNTIPALRTAAGARNWRLIGLRFTTTGGGDVISLGDGAQRDRTLVPSDLTLDRVIIRGDATKGQKRGIALNSANTRILNSYIAGIRLAGQESQAIAGWNGPGPFVIENNYIEAAAIGMLFGGAVPAIDQLVPSDIIIRRNHIMRPVSWRGGTWMVKNLLELKNARNVQIDGNLIENNWGRDQSGFAVVFTVRASGAAPWTTIEHVRFENNIVRHSGSAINVLGYDNLSPEPAAARPRHPQQPVHRHHSGHLGRNGHLPAARRRASRRPRRAQHGDAHRPRRLGLRRYAHRAARRRASASSATSSSTTPTASSATASAPATRRSPPTSRAA